MMKKPNLLLVLALVMLVLLAATERDVIAAQWSDVPRSRMMVALVIGQSNAANFGETRLRSRYGVYNLHKGYLYYARDPLRGSNGEGGSPWTRLGDKLIAAKLYDTVIFVPAAVGATEIAQWTPDGDLFELIENAVAGAKRRRFTITHIFWHQGESDAYFNTPINDYKARFMAMLDGIRALGVDAPIYVSVATRCGQYPENQFIQQAQRELVNSEFGIRAGPDTDALGADYRHDGCHFSIKGLDAHAELWFQIIKAEIESQLPTPQPD